ncbi:MAG TPA: protein kinase, partial [Pyrinomonadaceae bacterium]|nr:protein kinase [Pyrinomonadaceae bacterium]
MSSCFNCGATVATEDRFCGNCGIAVEPVSRPPGAHSHGGEPAPVRASGEPSNSLDEGGAAAEQHTTGVQSPASIQDAPAARESSDNFQPTIIEPSRGGQSAAPAPAQEPSEPARDSSQGLQDAASSTEQQNSPPSTDADAYGSATLVEPSPRPATDGGEAPPARTGLMDDASDRRQTGDMPQTPSAYTSSTGRSRRASSQLEPGTVLNDRYEIAKRIGGGGMGAVYYAKDKNLGDQPRAVKEMIQSHLDESQQEKAVADFKRESMLLASLEHPSIPTIYDYFYDDSASRFYLVMKYISGGDCLARLRNAPGGRIDELTVADWGMQVADVLEYLHGQPKPIIYRDLKPANLMIDGNSGRVMLIDFGIARWVAPQEKGVTAVGTMGYAPPELFSGKAEPRTDIYSLGATMFHLMTGADPQDNPLLIFDFTKNPTPRQINPGVSNEMEWILMHSVEYEPERRFRTAGDMRDALAQHIERLRAGAATYGVPGGARQEAKTLAVERVFCGFCGKSISSEDVFCPHCGARQPIAAASASLRAARATARLVVTGTTELDATFVLDKEINLVGRTDPQSNIFPDIDLSRFDPETKISRRHARVWREGDTFLVEDLGSVNGTVVNEAVRLGTRQP